MKEGKKDSDVLESLIWNLEKTFIGAFADDPYLFKPPFLSLETCAIFSELTCRIEHVLSQNPRFVARQARRQRLGCAGARASCTVAANV
ncbi:uncharacterized protein TrAtP1_003943 [Trichoderma atroviride]|uniref:uncharacterized protein n=1 Tax=Hypocrea atroviridis TaxID=63577 RepID=UPI003324B803|nr:hypothetical protein TrAtP1_003943 [Trichoderma atroviride]